MPTYGETSTFTGYIDIIKIKAFIGLLYLSGVFKSGIEDLEGLFANDCNGRNNILRNYEFE